MLDAGVVLGLVCWLVLGRVVRVLGLVRVLAGASVLVLGSAGAR